MSPLSDEDAQLLRRAGESAEQHAARIATVLPNFPAAVSKQWIVDHEEVVESYGWLGFGGLRFSLETWSTEDILARVSSSNELFVEQWRERLVLNHGVRESRLGAYMIRNGTWPVPPLVLDNQNALQRPDGVVLPRWALIEGHHRLGFLRGLHEDEELQVSPTHDVYVVTATETLSSDLP